MKAKYDFLIVGAGLYGAVFAHELKKAGKTCLIIEKRSHIAGNIYTEEIEYPGPQIRRPYFPYQQQRGMGICEPVCRIQRVCPQPDRKL